MTIYWNPDDPTDPDSIDVWHVADDGTENGPLTADLFGVAGMPDTFGGVAPDAVRDEIATWLKGRIDSGGVGDLEILVMLDMLSLDYEMGTPP